MRKSLSQRFLSHWFDKARPISKTSRRPRRIRLNLEILEDRTVPAGLQLHPAEFAAASIIAAAPVVADAALTEVSFTTPMATEGAAFVSTKVFDFTDADLSATPADYVATVQTGDGNTFTSAANPSIVKVVSVGSGEFAVQLTYTYAEELAAQTFSVSVNDVGGAAVNDSYTHFTVADAALTAGALTAPTPTQGTPLTDVQLFHFTDANPNAVAGNFIATITWGDGTTSTTTSTNSASGQIVGNAVSGFDVHGSHTYLTTATGLGFKVSVTDNSSYLNGFETAASILDVTDSATGANGANTMRMTSGTGQLPSAPAWGSYFAVSKNTNDDYQAGYGDAGYTFFGGAQKTYTGPFQQSVSIYINTAWAAPTNPNVAAFWLDMTPDHRDPNNYGAEHNFHFLVDGSGTIKVTADGDTNLVATITASGWYTFQMVYTKDVNPANPALTDLNVYDATNTLVGSKLGLLATNGGPLASSDLTGHGYAWLTVWQNNFAGNQLAIDNLNTSVLPIAASAPINVADDLAVTGTAFGITKSSPFSGQVATFNDGANTEVIGNFAASIHWGDAAGIGTDTAGVISQPGGTGTSYVVTGTHTYNANGPFTFTVTITETGDVSAVASNSATASVNFAPSVTLSPISHAASAGSATTFTAAATPGSPVTTTVQWQINTGGGFVNLANSGLYSGVTTTTLTVNRVTVDVDGAQYRAVFSNSAGLSATTAAATLTLGHSTYVYNAYVAAYYAFYNAYTAYQAGQGSYNDFYYSYYAYVYASNANYYDGIGSYAQSRSASNYAAYFESLANSYAAADYSRTGNPSLYYALYWGQFGQTDSNYNRLGY